MSSATKLTPTQAAAQWIEGKKLEKRARALLEPAAAALKTYFRDHPDVRSFKGVGYSVSSRDILDQAAVKEHLGKDLPKFLKTTPVESLHLLV